MISEGSSFPDFALQDQHGKTYTLEDLKGRKSVLFFYPKDDTAGWTIEANEFRDEFDRFKGVNVFGVSPDPVSSHEKFAKKLGLQYSLLADPERVLIDPLDLWVEKSLYGKKYFGVERSTFLLDADGKVLRVWRKVKPDGHAAEVLQALKESS